MSIPSLGGRMLAGLVVLAGASCVGRAGPRLVLHAETARFVGAAPGDELGRACIAWRDLDGDGLPELALGAPGGKAGFVGIHSVASDAPLVRVEVAGSNRFGESLATGFVDGDALLDLCVGAPSREMRTQPGRASLVAAAPGRVFVFPGRAEGFGEPVTLTGSRDGDEFGAALAWLPLESGGRLVVGAPRHTLGNPSSRGPGRIAVYGSDLSAPLFAIEGTADESFLGKTLMVLPDVDGDRVPDFAASSDRSVHVLSGADGRRLFTAQHGDWEPRLASSHGTLDWNGDGVVDVACWFLSFHKERRAVVGIVSGRNGEFLYREEYEGVGSVAAGAWGICLALRAGEVLCLRGPRAEPELWVKSPESFAQGLPAYFGATIAVATPALDAHRALVAVSDLHANEQRGVVHVFERSAQAAPAPPAAE